MASPAAPGRATDPAGGTPGGAPAGATGGSDPGADTTSGSQSSGGLRRLTVAQYTNAIRQLFGASVSARIDLEPDTSYDGFVAVGAAQLAVSPGAVEKFEAAALDVARQVFSDPNGRTKVAGCQPAGEDAACPRTFVSTVGRRIWRRPLTEEEITSYASFATTVAKQTKDPWLGLELALAGLLESPNFLYRVELGQPDPTTPGRLRLDSFELASRLSFLFLDSPPTDEVLDQASRGGLKDGPAVEALAKQLLADPRARPVFAAFFAELLDVDGAPDVVKNATIFPRMNQSLAKAMLEEVQRRVGYFAFDRTGPFLDLFDSPETFVNADLAALYGLPKPSTSGFSKTTFQAKQRTGIFGEAAFLATHAHSDRTSVTARGLAIRHLLCQQVPSPPPGVNTQLPQTSSVTKQTMRQRMASHATNPTCSACHASFDPLGLAFETLDGIGAYRKDDQGLPLDTTGSLDGAPFADGVELTHLVRKHDDLAPCFVRQVYRFAVGRREDTREEALLTGVGKTLSTATASLPAALMALVRSDEFRTVPTSP